jgi:hypothetical protein
MKKSAFLTTLTVVIGSILVSCPAWPVTAAIHSNFLAFPDLRIVRPNGDPTNDRPHPSHAPSPSCANPESAEAKRCGEIEQQILAATVRLEWHLWIKDGDGTGYTNVAKSVGHATIKDGRYLVTHNHPGMLRSDLKKGKYITASVFSADGKPIWLEVPLSLISTVVDEPGTWVIEFGNYTGRGPFDSPTLASAEFKAWKLIPLQPGMEVAQIDWDGETAHIEWVMVENVLTERMPPSLEIANFVKEGTSGGGIFWNGYHIANTWYQATELDPSSGAELRQYSVAVLDSSEVAAQ